MTSMENSLKKWWNLLACFWKAVECQSFRSGTHIVKYVPKTKVPLRSRVVFWPLLSSSRFYLGFLPLMPFLNGKESDEKVLQQVLERDQNTDWPVTAVCSLSHGMPSGYPSHDLIKHYFVLLGISLRTLEAQKWSFLKALCQREKTFIQMFEHPRRWCSPSKLQLGNFINAEMACCWVATDAAVEPIA